MSLSPEDTRDCSPAPWSPKAPWMPVRETPGAFPASPAPEQNLAVISAQHSLSAAVKARKDEYIRKRSIQVKVGTWNVASISGTEKDLGGWFVKGLGVKGLSQDLAGLNVESTADLTADEQVESVQDQEARLAKKKTTLPKHDVAAVPHGQEIGLYVLGLQEVVDVTSAADALKPFTDPNPAKKWKAAMRKALPPGYEKIAEQQLLGLLILVFASPELTPTISSVSCTSVGTGLMGYLGNKGAVCCRMVLAETTKLCFINCHLAAGADSAALTRRIWDTNQIMSRVRFAPVSLDGEVVEVPEEKIGDEDFAFWFGDLNFRLEDIPGEDVRRLLLLHTRNEYDIANKSKRRIDSELGYLPAPSEDSLPTNHYEYADVERPASQSNAEPTLDPKSDPASLHTTIQSLLSHDQLKVQQRLKKAFHDGWKEGDINFLPTYKYDVGSVGMFDSGEKKRSPSWCDRILFRTRRGRILYAEKAKQESEALKKDEDMKKRGLDKAAADQDVLFAYDPDTDGAAYDDDYDEVEDAFQDAELIRTHEDFEEEIELEHYISHQRVLSSDHKPLDATFTLIYDAVIPELKAKVHQEVARQLDKAENEGRPAVTVVVDNPSDIESDTDDSTEQSDLSGVQFGNVRYEVRKTRYMTVANTGQIEATFSFVSRGDGGDTSIAPSWLNIRTSAENHEAVSEGKSTTLPPGETMTVELTTQISDPAFVYDLNQNMAQLDDVLVLRVKNGRDHFIPIKGLWLQSCFCRSLDELVTAPEGGVRRLPRSAKNRDSTGANNVKSSQTHHSAPKELFDLTESIPSHVERSIADWEMLHPGETPPWRQNGDDTTWPFDPNSWTFHPGEERSSMLATIREALDTSKPLEAQFDPVLVLCLVRLEVLAETLTSFLQSLRDGIITATIWTTIDQHLTALEKEKSHPPPEDLQSLAMDALSSAPVHSVSMTFLTFTLTRIINELAPAAKEQQLNSPQPPSRRSRASTVSSEAGSETSASPSVESGSASTSKRSFFPAIRRRRVTSSAAATATPTAAEMEAASVAERRKVLMRNYAGVFAPLVIRAEGDGTSKGKERKVLEARKRRVLEAFLETAQV